ncbi:MAG: hypothetical protein PHI33_06075 [Smithellaceae bacterium]|nr:hypothetical protein [Smithellaceae bacterium]
MKKLEKRQIIILAVAALFALYAAYEFLIARPSAKKIKAEANPVQVESFVSTLSSDLMKYKVVGVDTYIIKKAETDWNKSPFWEKVSYREFTGNKAGGVAAAKIIYSGYVDTGSKKIAIINGLEYEAGESLDVDDFALKRVTPSRILVVNPKTGSELYFPIQE